MKLNVTKFCLYMLNQWCQSEACAAFAAAPCGWEYLWKCYERLVCNTGRSAAAVEFFFSIDGNLQQMLCEHIENTYTA